jgi:hypothetical protein
MKSFIDYLDCGAIRKNSTWIDYTVVSYNDLIFKIVPFFEKYKIIGVKLQDYLDLKRVAELMKTKDHLTTLGFFCCLSIEWKANEKKLRRLKKEFGKRSMNKKR